MGNTKVTGLTPKTEYSLTVYAVYPGLIGESSTVITETSKYYYHQITKSQIGVYCLVIRNRVNNFNFAVLIKKKKYAFSMMQNDSNMEYYYYYFGEYFRTKKP